MADSFSKKENNKKKLEKAKEKAARREEKKTNNNKGKEIEFMYVDKFGQLTSVKPEKQEDDEDFDLNNIQLGAAPIVDEGPEEITGVVDYVSDKGYGFIKETGSGDNIFFHMNNAQEELKKGNKVTYDKEKSPKGFAAVNIKVIK